MLEALSPEGLEPKWLPRRRLLLHIRTAHARARGSETRHEGTVGDDDENAKPSEEKTKKMVMVIEEEEEDHDQHVNESVQDPTTFPIKPVSSYQSAS